MVQADNSKDWGIIWKDRIPNLLRFVSKQPKLHKNSLQLKPNQGFGLRVLRKRKERPFGKFS